MTKKCSGCGIILQTEDINKEGYTENIDMMKQSFPEYFK